MGTAVGVMCVPLFLSAWKHIEWPNLVHAPRHPAVSPWLRGPKVRGQGRSARRWAEAWVALTECLFIFYAVWSRFAALFQANQKLFLATRQLQEALSDIAAGPTAVFHWLRSRRIYSHWAYTSSYKDVSEFRIIRRSCLLSVVELKQRHAFSKIYEWAIFKVTLYWTI